MNLFVPDQLSILMQRAEAHALLATEAAAIAFELVAQRHLAEAVLFRATARNHRIRQLEILASIGAFEAVSDSDETSWS
ncbi:hypothetical protein [Methylobacterium sp. J-070]|uniref:hypothetical protein n=1 Tax=Methylobacterium sp. J-070 TaxID=2836650 RepID=UPI001FBB782C|nr:hypothetical protein [Methylobacterium sp. J-070]MCJ2054468.1 hypothetical protein [Methylobacterium sp. J-070]